MTIMPANPSPAKRIRYGSGASTDLLGSSKRNDGNAKPKVRAAPNASGNARIANNNPGEPSNRIWLRKCQVVQAEELASRMPATLLMKNTPRHRVAHNNQNAFILRPVDFAFLP